MIYLGKFIFLLIMLALFPLWRVFFADYGKVKTMDGFDELSQWEKIKFHAVFVGITFCCLVVEATMITLIFGLPWVL